jgi:DNA-binding MarR family transcriptional regulator
MKSRLDEILGYHLRRAQLYAFGSFAQGLASTGLTPMLYGVLATVEAAPGIGQGEIADALGTDRSSMVRLVDQLERRDLVRRAPHPDDRRTVIPTLTPAGRTLLDEATPLVEAREAGFTGALSTTERDQLIELLRKLNSARA